MKQYNAQQKKKIVEVINKVKNKKPQALKFNIRTYYYWKKKLEKIGIIENKSRKPKNIPNKFRVHCIQGSACGNNGTEFTYPKHLFETEPN